MIIGILNSGGDCPGINAVIEGYVSAADRASGTEHDKAQAAAEFFTLHC